jgi:CubicO group peptidase (beta-lactamase class C family)
MQSGGELLPSQFHTLYKFVRRSSFCIFACFFSLHAWPTRAQQEAGRFARAYERIDEFIAQHMKQAGTPGMALAITSRDELLRVQTYGLADIKMRRPITPETLFEIGSISKSFTAICLLQLHEAGKLDFQQPVAKYLPWFTVKTKYPPITVHHLLTHTSGLPRDRDDIPSSPFQAAALSERETGYAPGTKWAYSNIGFQTLGYLLEELDGRPSYESVRKRIIEPLGMKSTETSIRQEMRAKLAVGYAPFYDDRPEGASDELVEATYGDYGAGDGAISSTPADLAIYVRALLNRGALLNHGALLSPDALSNHGALPGGRLISEESFQLLTQRTVPTERHGKEFYGYGMDIWQEEGHTLIGHGGGMIGYTSSIKADLDAGLGVVVFLNGPGSPDQVAEFAIKTVRAAQEKRALPPLPAADAKSVVTNAADYAGVYTSAEGKKLAFVAQGARLGLLYEAERVALEKRGKDSFYALDPDFKLFLLRFGREAKKAGENSAGESSQGKVVEVFYGPEWFANDRYKGPRTFDTPKEWRDYVGHYRSYSPWISNLRIAIRKGKLVVLYPSGEAEELMALPSGEFQPGEEPTAERIYFEKVAGGKAVRLSYSGVYLYKTFTP